MIICPNCKGNHTISDHQSSLEYKEKILKKTEVALKEIFAKYKIMGLKAVYVWGSILREDFNPPNSDVDTMAIASEMVPEELEVQIQKELVGKVPEVKKFGFRLLYENVLRNGEAKGFLSSVQSPKSHLLDFPNWKFVEGKRYQQSDFAQALPSYQSALMDEIPLLRDRMKDYENNNIGRYQFLIKKIAQIIYLLQKERGVKGNFSYTEIVNNAPEGLEKETAVALCEIKYADYDLNLIKKHFATLQKFIDYIYSIELV